MLGSFIYGYPCQVPGPNPNRDHSRWPKLEQQKGTYCWTLSVVAMASVTNPLFYVFGPKICLRNELNSVKICHQTLSQRCKLFLFPSISVPFRDMPTTKQSSSIITCFASDKPTSSSEIRFSLPSFSSLFSFLLVLWNFCKHMFFCCENVCIKVAIFYKFLICNSFSYVIRLQEQTLPFVCVYIYI